MDLFGTSTEDRWLAFHDESECHREHFLYHGWLFVHESRWREILQHLLRPDPAFPDNRDKRVHFTGLRNLEGVRAHAAVSWVRAFVDDWIPKGTVRFYCLGVNLNNINYEIYRESAKASRVQRSHGDRIYSRFYEIALRSALAWFSIPPDRMSHLYYDQGKVDIERYSRALGIFGGNTVVRPLANDCRNSGYSGSKFLQLTDVILGSFRCSFSGVGNRRSAQERCIDLLLSAIESLCNLKSAYNPHGPYWKKLGLSFFPCDQNLSAKDFFTRSLEYHRATSFYTKRLTKRQAIEASYQTELRL